MITRTNTERIRINYASGVYDRYELWDSYRHEVTPNELEDILGYEVFEDVRVDLMDAIMEVDRVRELKEEYQMELRREVEKCENFERAGTTYPFEDRKRQLDNRLEEALNVAV